MSKKGKTPSLIGGGAGKSDFVVAKRKRKCKRCSGYIHKDENCVEVKIPNTLNHKTYCFDCFKETLEQSQRDLDALKEKVNSF